MDDTLLMNLRNDLEKSGFGAEMKVLKTMVECGWHQVGSDTYHDEDEDISRDIDASGFIQRWCTVDKKTVAMVFVFF